MTFLLWGDGANQCEPKSILSKWLIQLFLSLSFWSVIAVKDQCQTSACGHICLTRPFSPLPLIKTNKGIGKKWGKWNKSSAMVQRVDPCKEMVVKKSWDRQWFTFNSRWVSNTRVTLWKMWLVLFPATSGEGEAAECWEAWTYVLSQFVSVTLSDSEESVRAGLAGQTAARWGGSSRFIERWKKDLPDVCLC